MNWVMIVNSSGEFTVGFYQPRNQITMNADRDRYTVWEFYPVKDFDTYDEAAAEIHYLNGGERGPGVYPI